MTLAARGDVVARQSGRAVAAAARFAARALTGVRPIRHGAPPAGGPCVYFANHRSHGDIVLIQATLPRRQRLAARPVAGGDYWEASPLRRFLGRHVVRALSIDRDGAWSAIVPLRCMGQALDRGESLIVFPEGTRNGTGAALLPFKGGLFHLGRSHPHVDLVPVWIANAGRAWPKGRRWPVPTLCTVSYGAPLRVEPGEDRDAFMRRATAAVEALRPPTHEAAR